MKPSIFWANLTQEQQKNLISTYTGIKPKDVDLTGLEFQDLDKYVIMAIQDMASEVKEK